jgi:Tfp pilus assembly protein PilV
MAPFTKCNQRRRTRRGATLIELLVALVLFDLTLLTTVAMSALAVRQLGDAARRNRAAIAGASRIEWMAARPCGTASSGSATLERGVTELWRSTALMGSRELLDSIRVDSRSPEHLVLRARSAC